MKIKLIPLSLAALLATVVSAPSPVLANGAVFFDEEGEHEVPDGGTVYFGSVKDERGRAVVGAVVEIKVKGEDGEYATRTNPLGRYVNFRVRNYIDPKDVEVKVVMPGYEMVSATNRSRLKVQGADQEINFVLKAGVAKPAAAR